MIDDQYMRPSGNLDFRAGEFIRINVVFLVQNNAVHVRGLVELVLKCFKITFRVFHEVAKVPTIEQATLEAQLQTSNTR